jgi:crossover junction endodeoxyribonuclease RuvC
VSVSRIIGIDPGLASTGWGIVEADGARLRYIDHGCIQTKPDTPHAERLLFIHNELRAILERFHPALSAMETLFFARNAKTAMPVGEARGVLCMTLAQAGLALREFSPNALKQAITGVARAEKRQVQEMVRLILGLESIPRPDHAADALAAAIAAAGHPPVGLLRAP